MLGTPTMEKIDTRMVIQIDRQLIIPEKAVISIEIPEVISIAIEGIIEEAIDGGSIIATIGDRTAEEIIQAIGQGQDAILTINGIEAFGGIIAVNDKKIINNGATTGAKENDGTVNCTFTVRFIVS